MVTDRDEKTGDQPTVLQPKPETRDDINEILFWVFAFALLFFTITQGAILLIDNTSTRLNGPIPLIGGDG
jgi:hypothetical protein